MANARRVAVGSTTQASPRCLVGSHIAVGERENVVEVQRRFSRTAKYRHAARVQNVGSRNGGSSPDGEWSDRS